MNPLKENNIETFIELLGIDENLLDATVYELYKDSTDEPYTKTMFTRYLKEHKGYKQIRKSVLGKRYFFYIKV